MVIVDLVNGWEGADMMIAGDKKNRVAKFGTFRIIVKEFFGLLAFILIMPQK